MRGTSQRLGFSLAISVGLLSGLNCGETSDSIGDGHNDETPGGSDETPDGAGGGTPDGAGGETDELLDNDGPRDFLGTGGTKSSPVTNECWFEDNAECGMGGMGGTTESCLISADIVVICSVHGFGYMPEVMPLPEVLDMHFVANLRFAEESSTRSYDMHGLLAPDGSVALTNLRSEASPALEYIMVAGFDWETGAVDLLYEVDDLVSVSEPYDSAVGVATWVPALQLASSLRLFARAPDGTIHVLASRTDFTEGHAFGTTEGGFTEMEAGWTEYPLALAFTHDSEVVGVSVQDDEPTILVAERLGQTAQALTQFDQNIALVTVAGGSVTSAAAPDYVVVAAGGTTLRVVPSPGSGLDSLDLPLKWAPSGDCEAEGCQGSCEFTGDWISGVSATRTPDGRLWVSARIVHEDTVTEYAVLTSEDAYICGSQYSRDESSSEVVLYEVDLNAGRAEEVLKLSVAGLAPTQFNRDRYADYAYENLKLTAAGAEVWITLPVITPDLARHSFRTIRLDTTRIP